MTASNCLSVKNSINQTPIKPGAGYAGRWESDIMVRRILISVVLVLSSGWAQAATPWTEIAERVSAYVSHPSPAKATEAINAIPQEFAGFTHSSEESEALNSIYSARTIRVLEQRVLKQERESVELAFRLRCIADGAFLEDLEIIVGKIIKRDPEMFLRELQRAKVPVRAMGGLVGNLGEAYVDKIDMQCKELQLRRKALEKVSSATLQDTKNAAVAKLNAQLARCRSSQHNLEPDKRHRVVL